MNANEKKIATQSVDKSAQPQKHPLCCPRILVVDDDPYTRAMNVGILMWSGYDVQSVANGDDAWKALDVFNYDLLITENEMPGVTGIQLLKNLRSKGIAMPVIMASGKVPTKELKLHPNLRLEAALVKPVPSHTLLQAVKNILHAAETFARHAPQNDMMEKRIPQVAEPPSTAETPRKNFPKRILVVDDEPLICRLYSELLVDSGYEVDTAEDGAVAWDELQRNGYDLLVTDNEMLKMSGIELLKKLQAARMSLPVIMVSATMPTMDLERNPWLHLDGVLLKPFNIFEFVGIVKKVLNTTCMVVNSAPLFRNSAMGNEFS